MHFTCKCQTEIIGQTKEMAGKDSVKINKQKPHLNCNFEACRGSFHLSFIVTSPKQEEMDFQFPPGKCFSTLLLQQEEGVSFPHLATTQPMEDCYKSSSEKPLHFELPVSSKRLLIYSCPSELPLSFMNPPLSFVL